MGKRKDKNVSYSRQNLEIVARNLEVARKPISDGDIPKIRVNRKALEKVIKDLPKKERKAVEKFFGLIPGTINHSQNIFGLGKVAYNNMLQEAKDVLTKLVSVEYLVKFDETVAKLVESLAKKVNKGDLKLSDIDVCKYLNILCIVFDGGPQMPFDNEDKINLDSENLFFDDYAMLNVLYKSLVDSIPDHSLNLRLLQEAIDMLDVADVIAIKRFVGLELTKKEEAEFGEEVKVSTLREVRLLKERVFPYGIWNETIELILGKYKNFNQFIEAMTLVRQDLSNLAKYETGEEDSFPTSKGITTVKKIKIGDLEFTDPYEVMFWCVSRNIIL